jgi:hypothetical protein
MHRWRYAALEAHQSFSTLRQRVMQSFVDQALLTRCFLAWAKAAGVVVRPGGGSGSNDLRGGGRGGGSGGGSGAPPMQSPAQWLAGR